jgi:cell division protein FtsB
VSASAPARRGMRPVSAFFLSFFASTLLLCLLLASDRRVFELKKAHQEVKLLDRQIEDLTRENEDLKAAAEAARKHDFPAEKAAREELNLVAPDEAVLLYPPGSLTAKKVPPTPVVKR